MADDLQQASQQVALKVMTYTPASYTAARREVIFAGASRHANIVALLDVFVERVADQHKRGGSGGGSSLVLVFELLDGPDLLELLNQRGGPLPLDEACFYVAQLLRGLLFMHASGFAHRDLKAENVVVEPSSGRVKVIDFGLTKHVDSVKTLRVGTPEYMAPEVLQAPQPPGGHAGAAAGGAAGGGLPYDARKVDAWALGVLLYVLVCGRYPFDQDPAAPSSTVAVYRSLLAGRYAPLPRHVSADAGRLIAGLLTVDAQRRLGLEDVAADPWLLQMAMAFALPRGLQHLVQPPLAPQQPQQLPEPPTSKADSQVTDAAALSAEDVPASKPTPAQQSQEQPQAQEQQKLAARQPSARLPAIEFIQSAAATNLPAARVVVHTGLQPLNTPPGGSAAAASDTAASGSAPEVPSVLPSLQQQQLQQPAGAQPADAAQHQQRDQQEQQQAAAQLRLTRTTLGVAAAAAAGPQQVARTETAAKHASVAEWQQRHAAHAPAPERTATAAAGHGRSRVSEQAAPPPSASSGGRSCGCSGGCVVC